MSKANTEFNHTDGVTLKEHFSQRMDDLEEKLEARFVSQQTAVEKAEITMTARLEGMNEFRTAMSDAASRFVTREELKLKFEAEGNDRKDSIALFISIASIILSLVFSILKFVIK